MKRLPVVLADGDTHFIGTPSYYALGLMKQYGFDLANPGNVKTDETTGEEYVDIDPFVSIPAILAALLTDAEPFSNGRPQKVWTFEEAAKLVPTGELEGLMNAVSSLLEDAAPAAPKPSKSKGGGNRPNPNEKTSTGDEKP